MDCKLITYNINKYGGYISFFDRLFVTICQRAGHRFVLFKHCAPYPPIYLVNPPIIHVNGIYLQLFNWSLEIAWKSDNCYEL
jgi:hypothetical protein